MTEEQKRALRKAIGRRALVDAVVLLMEYINAVHEKRGDPSPFVFNEAGDLELNRSLFGSNNQ